ncbi:hypothetical protein FHT15_001568 [Xanthomonas campestris]
MADDRFFGWRPVFNTASHGVECPMHACGGGMQKVPFICTPLNWFAGRQSEDF